VISYVNGAPISPAGRILVGVGTPIVTYSGGIPYDANGHIVVVLGQPETYNAGIPYRQGALCVVASEVAGPVFGDFNSGWPTGALGRLLLSRTHPVQRYVNGWPIANNGAIAVANM
jgi:hypothetical protein